MTLVQGKKEPSPPTWLSLKMFFLRSMILMAPSFVSFAISPLWNQPSASKSSSVFFLSL